MNPAQTAVRIQNSLLSGVEKKALVWLATRMPAAVNSDHLTVLGLVAMLGAGVGYIAAGSNPAWLWAVNLLILINWFGDSLDGTLARVRNRQRPNYGFYVDHVVDALSAVFLFGGLGLSGFMSPGVAVALLIAYLLLSIESYLATHTVGEFRISHYGFSPTELRLLLIVGNLFLLRRPHATIAGEQYLLFDVGGIIGAAGMLTLFILAVARNAGTLYRQERLD